MNIREKILINYQYKISLYSNLFFHINISENRKYVVSEKTTSNKIDNCSSYKMIE